MRILTTVAVVWLGSATHIAAQTLSLSGLWQRVDPPIVGAAEDLAPTWEVIAIDASIVTIRRSAQAAVTEVYTLDDDQRTVVRVPGQTRTCRARWDEGAFVLACHQTGTGPGGRTAPVDTLETRVIDDADQLVVALTWTSGAKTVHRHSVYRRAE